jgi:hypothetical protein
MSPAPLLTAGAGSLGPGRVTDGPLMAGRSDTRFLTVSLVVVALGILIALLTPLVAGSGSAFRGSIVASGLVSLVFALQHLRRFRWHGRPHVPEAAVTLVFGGWFISAPLLYDVGFVATAGIQSAGLLVAAFSGYLAVVALTDTP